MENYGFIGDDILIKTEKINFAIDKDFKKEIDKHIMKNKYKYESRTDFLYVAIRKLIQEDNEITTKEILFDLCKEIRELKSLINTSGRNINSIKSNLNKSNNHQYRRH